MNEVLWHYASGSCSAEWLRMSRAIEAAEDFAPLGTGPLPAATEWSEEFPPDDITEQVTV